MPTTVMSLEDILAKPDDADIVELHAVHVGDKLIDEMNALLSALASDPARACSVDHESLVRILRHEGTRIFALRLGGIGHVSMVTLVTMYLPTGIKCEIQDVATLPDHRGFGHAKALMMHAIKAAHASGAKQVDLTSKPMRDSAHSLYEGLGFVQRETDNFRLALK